MGGPTNVVGTVDALVKVGRSNESQTFLVLTTPIAGYDVLLGQDYMQNVGCAIRISQAGCTLEIGQDSDNLVAKMHRPLHSSRLIHKESAFLLRPHGIPKYQRK
jgi:hypothetical protein